MSNVKYDEELLVLKELIDELISFADIPDPNCYCHRCSPCGDCVNYAYIRDVIDNIESKLSDIKVMHADNSQGNGSELIASVESTFDIHPEEQINHVFISLTKPVINNHGKWWLE